jgi:hypothetical protein
VASLASKSLQFKKERRFMLFLATGKATHLGPVSF